MTDEHPDAADSDKPGDVDRVTLAEGDVAVVATDEATGVVSQGETKAAALENLAEALRLYHRPVPDGHTIDPDDPLLEIAVSRSLVLTIRGLSPREMRTALMKNDDQEATDE